MHCSTTSMPDHKRAFSSLLKGSVLAFVFLLGHGLHGWAQETDFSPFARFGLGTSQGNLAPSLASMGGITSISASNLAVNADQPAAAAGLANPTFQGSIHLQGMQLSEGDSTANALTGGPGNFGLVIKQPRSLSAFQLGLTPMTSKSFGVSRTLTDTTLGSIAESYNGSGGLARAYVGLAHGWRGRTWLNAGADSVLITSRGMDVGFQVDHWFGDAVQTSILDIQDLTFRDVRTVMSSRHRATGWVFGAEAFQVLRARYDEFKQFRGSWTVRAGATIGARCIVGCGLEIGRFAMIGMGAVVTRSIPEFHLMIGSPARSVGVVCRCGQPIHRFTEADEVTGSLPVSCECGLAYEIEGQNVKELFTFNPGGAMERFRNSNSVSECR